MRLLLDTHVAIWAISGNPKLSKIARQLVADPSAEIFVSAVTIWEIAIKFRLRGRVVDPILLSGVDAMREFQNAGLVLLPVSPEHAAEVDLLPLHHGDPFDRLLAAQARHLQLQLLTQDAKLSAYGEFVLVV